MNTALFLTEWAIRSSILILAGALLLRALRVKDPSVRLLAWTAMLCGSVMLPVLSTAVPKLPLGVMPLAAASPASQVQTLRIDPQAAPVFDSNRQVGAASKPLDWALAAMAIYSGVAGTLLLRLGAGLWMSRRLRDMSRATGMVREGVEIRESDEVSAPVTLGIVRPAIVLPADWPEWDGGRLDAVLAHEMSHIRRWDPAVQLLSAMHRSLLWHSPLSWILHRRIVDLAEEASDDAALAVTQDRASYAELLLEFMQRGVRRTNWEGVAMARYGQPADRIHRILDKTVLSNGITRSSVAAMFIAGLPLAYVAAAADRPRRIETITPPAAVTLMAQEQRRPAAPDQLAPPRASTSSNNATIRRYKIFLGNTQSGHWDSRDPISDTELRARFGDRFAWFHESGAEYAITDAGVLKEMERAMEPQNKVNRMQDEVNRQQSVVNDLQSKVNEQQNGVNQLQSKVNSRQNDVNAAQQEVSRLQQALSRIQAGADRGGREELIQKMEAAIRELRAGTGKGDQQTVNRLQGEVNEAQSRVNEAQSKVNQAQDVVNREQNKVNQEQSKVNEEQRRVSVEFSSRIQEIFDTARRNGSAKRLN